MLIYALVSLLSAVRLTLASPEPPLPGYGVEELMWSVDAQDGLPPVTLNGTIQEVHRQTLQMNPAFKLERNLTRRSLDIVLASSNLTTLLCMNFPFATCSNLQDGAQYLETVVGVPVNGAGPGNCGRVSCSYGAAIWFCNDNPVPLMLHDFGMIAVGALAITNQCNGGCGNHANGMPNWMSGQQFFTGNWNVIAQAGDC